MKKMIIGHMFTQLKRGERMRYEKSQIRSMIIAAIAMIVVIVLAVIVNQPKKSEHEKKQSTVTTTEINTKQTEKATEKTTEEKMTEAPRDTSDWEMQPAEDETPDTGERIKD